MERGRSREQSKSPSRKHRHEKLSPERSALAKNYGPKASSSNSQPQLPVEDLITISANDNNYKSSPIVNFDEVDFPQAFFSIFKSLGYVRPTKIQANAIPIALEFFDIIGVAKTGSGKTLSFVLPVLMAIQDEKEFCKRNNKLYDNQKKPRALVMAPTRELVCQIYECAKPFVKAVDLDVACIYGGADSHPQRHDLSRGADLLIATPGRLHDFIQRGHVELNEVFILVLDEADRMLDMGFLPQVKSIVDYLKPKRQTLLWSATWPREVEELSRNLCKNRPITIRVGNEGLTINPNITQHVILCEDEAKKRELIGLLRRCQKSPTDKTLIFTSTKRMCDVLAKTLENEGFPALAIHGDKTQPERDKILSDFKAHINVLVATDVASRGLDIKNIKAVVNYDFPSSIEDYVHRIGRTGRAGNFGESFTFFSHRDSNHAQDLIDLLRKAQQKVPSDLLPMAQNCGGSKSRFMFLGSAR